MKIAAGIYKTQDHLYFEPENPVWEDIFKSGLFIGRKLMNPLIVKKGSYVLAINENNPFRESLMLVFGKYPCLPMLLNKVATVRIKNIKI